MRTTRRVFLELEDGTRLAGSSFGHFGQASGEVVFSTGMTGYVESLTDPSFRGQILVMTYPLIGNYGVPDKAEAERFESDRIQVAGLVVARAHDDQSHAGAARSLPEWLASEEIPGVEGIDTRHLTLRLREHGTMLGRILPAPDDEPRINTDSRADVSEKTICVHRCPSVVSRNPGEVTPAELVPMFDPNRIDVVSTVTVKEPEAWDAGQGTKNERQKRVILVDCGVKNSIRRELLARGVEVRQVPSNWDYTGELFDGILVSNGPGNPEQCPTTIEVLRRAMALGRPILGICLGTQLMALAAGARTYKLRYGHRGQNQPCRESGSDRCRLTSQNHGYAVDARTLPDDWQVWFTNINDGSVEGIRHKRRPFAGVQFHPEASPGPLDSRDLFDRFVESL